MQKIKAFLIIVIIFFMLITVMAALMPSRVMSVRSVMINAPYEKIVTQLFDLKNWKNWNPSIQKAKSVNVSEPSNGKGATLTWDYGDTPYTIDLYSVSDSAIRFVIKRKGENDINTDVIISSFEHETGLQVEWRSIHSLKWYPWDKFAGMFIDQTAGSGYEAALDGLKNFVESH